MYWEGAGPEVVLSSSDGGCSKKDSKDVLS